MESIGACDINTVALLKWIVASVNVKVLCLATNTILEYLAQHTRSMNPYQVKFSILVVSSLMFICYCF